MIPGLTVFEYQNQAFVSSRCILPRSSNIQMFHVPTSVSNLARSPSMDMLSHLETEDNDPLTSEEIADLEESIQDLECGRAEVLPAEMSDEEVIARLDTL